jgi:hypothetical protein
MCRNAENGGRRCPHDDSNARRLRRANAALKSAYTGAVHEPIHSDRVNQENVVVQVIASAPTIEEIKAEAASIKDLKELLWDGKARIRDIPLEELIIDGVLYESHIAYGEEMQRRIESKTVHLGSMVALAAAAKTGFTDEMIINGNEAAKAQAEVDYETAKKAYSDFCEMAKERYGVSAMDAPYHLGNKAESIEAKADRAAAEGEEYIPEFDTKEAKALAEEGKNLYANSESARSRLSSVKSSGDEASIEMTKANRLAQHEIMKEIRELGGNAVVHERSNKDKVKILNEALEFFPKDWIDKSNETGSNLMVKKTTRRAHYTDGSSQKEYKVVKQGYLKTLDNGEEPDNTRYQSGWIKVEADENGDVNYVDENGINHEMYVGEGKTAYYAPTWEYHSPYSHGYIPEGGKPKGRGWVSAVIQDSNFDYETKTHTPFENTVWRRQVTRRNMVSISTTAELLIDGSIYSRDEGKATAVHEFSHRVEAKDDHIGRIETAFIKRRTTLPDGTSEPSVRIYAKKDEYGQPDNFVDNYMGKSYSHSSGKHWEVLSTGAEAVWAGAFGSFMGLGGYKPDTEHRNFVLGVFAGF